MYAYGHPCLELVVCESNSTMDYEEHSTFTWIKCIDLFNSSINQGREHRYDSIASIKDSLDISYLTLRIYTNMILGNFQ
jgi:hypothetical protein